MPLVPHNHLTKVPMIAQFPRWRGSDWAARRVHRPHPQRTATMAAKPAATADDEDDDTGADAGGSEDADAGSEGDDAEQQPSVVATILCYPDGSYGLTQGDENEEDAGGESQGAPAGGEDTGAGGGAGEGAEPQRFASIGELLHGVMSAVKDFEATKGGGTEAEGMAAGYAGAGGGGAAGGM